jgi:hypothetical protein
VAYQDTLNIKEKDLDREIYRIMPIHRLLEAFYINKLTLVKPEKWGDPFENLLLKGTAKNLEVEVLNFDSIRESVYGCVGHFIKKQMQCGASIHLINKEQKLKQLLESY